MWLFSRRRQVVVPPAPVDTNPQGEPRTAGTHKIRALVEPREPEHPTIPPFDGHPVDDPLLDKVRFQGAKASLMETAEQLDTLFEKIQVPKATPPIRETKPPRPENPPTFRR